MGGRAWLGGLVVLAPLALTGCPVTDDYYIEAEQGGTSVGGSAASISSAGTEPQGGVHDVSGTGGGAGCVAANERCNGHDDDCDDVVDELACNSATYGTVSCSGFVLEGRPDHGYMMCSNPTTYAEAKAACAAQNMRLAWLESAAENTAVAEKVNALSRDIEVTIGANDIANEDAWFWDDGPQFWQGDKDGSPVDGAFSRWLDGTPNNENGNEDCAVLDSSSAHWGDRSCAAKYGYLCEEPEP
jgi:hypothetical protein